ncbi:unnamed protein product [Arctogadus glacialis]
MPNTTRHRQPSHQTHITHQHTHTHTHHLVHTHALHHTHTHIHSSPQKHTHNTATQRDITHITHTYAQTCPTTTLRTCDVTPWNCVSFTPLPEHNVCSDSTPAAPPTH